MRIKCEKYIWDNTTDINEVSFFTDLNNYTAGDVINLNEYLIKDSLSEFTLSAQSIDENNNLAFEAGSVTMNLINKLYSGTDLIDYFQIYENADFIKFKITFYNEAGAEFYFGYLRPDGIRMDSVREKIISITVVTEEMEFKDYFSNKLLADAGTIINTNPIGGEVDLLGFRQFRVRAILNLNFPNVVFDNLDWLDNHFISQRPYTYAPFTKSYDGNFLFMKSGYDCFRKDNVDRFTFFNNLLTCWGWSWFFSNGKLHIKERSQSNTISVIYDYLNHVILHSLENTKYEQVDNIMISDGEIYGGNDNAGFGFIVTTNVSGEYHYLGGSRAVNYSEKNKWYNQSRSFRSISFSNSGNYTYSVSNWRYHNRENDSELTYKNIVYRVNPGSAVEKTEYNFPVIKTMVLNPYIPTRENSGAVNFRTPYFNYPGTPFQDGNTYYGISNAYGSDLDFGLNGIGYTGNAGSCMWKWDGVKYISYEYYTQTEAFRNNFRMFLKTGKDLIHVIEVIGILNTMTNGVKLINYPYADLSQKIFTILNLSFDYFNNTTKITIT